MLKSIIIIGGGHAGAQAAASLRDKGFDGRVMLISQDTHLPYHRPPLSKAYLKNGGDPPWIRPEQYYAQRNIDCLLGVTVERIDRDRGVVSIGQGRELEFDGLIYAAGSTVRTLDIPGLPAAPNSSGDGWSNENPPNQDPIQSGSKRIGPYYLKTLDDSQRLTGALQHNAKIAVIGGGFIGLEVAATARQIGCEVAIIEASSRFMGRAVSDEISSAFLDLHRDAGCDIRLNAGVQSAASGNGDGFELALSDGAKIDVSAVVIGIGVIPNTALAEQAGLRCANGVVVDRAMRTSDARIVAAGDCVSFQRSDDGKFVRLEAVQNANDQARTAVATLLDEPTTYDAVPWFWSDQYETKLQIAGLLPETGEAVVRGDPGSGKMSVLHFSDDRLVCVESINRPGDHVAARKLLTLGRSPTPDQAADADFDLRGLAKA